MFSLFIYNYLSKLLQFFKALDVTFFFSPMLNVKNDGGNVKKPVQ